MKNFEKRTQSSAFFAVCMGIVLTITSCSLFPWFDSELEKTIKTAVDDGEISKTEAQKIIKAFEEDGTYTSLKERVEYVASLCDIEEEDIRNALDIIVPPNSKSVFVYLDNTESMRGYIDATDAGKFASVLSAINDFYSKNDDVSVKAFYTEALKQEGKKVTNIVSVDFAQLRSNLIEHTMQKFTDSYQLNDFFNDVTNRLRNDSINSSICFFITDGIPSGTNEEINPPGRKLKLEERKFNISQKKELQSRIADAIRPLGKDGGYGAAIFQFFAPYKGKYWKYNNDHATQLDNIERPFYVIAVGQKELLEDFLGNVEKGLNSFAPQKMVSFLEGNGLFVPHNPEYLEKKEGKSNEFIFKAEQLNDDEDKDETMATLYFKLKELPSYLRDTAMLSSTVKIEVEKVEVDKVVKADRIDFKVKAREEATQKVRIIVEDSLPKWVKDSNSLDDSALSPQNLKELGRTFNLEIVVRGIEQGIFNKGGERNAIDATFILDSNTN